MRSTKIFVKNLLLFFLVGLLGCENFLEENPKTALNEGVFWRNEKEATMGLMGVYWKRPISPSAAWGPYTASITYADQWTDIGTCIRPGAPSHWPSEGLYSTEQQVSVFWEDCWDKISRCNYFLDNIERVQMDEDKKTEMISEVRFLRANWYFWLVQMYGGVPLVTSTLSFEQANSIARSSQEEVVDFTLNELTEAAEHLPVKRPASERGRAEKGAALSVKGRLLMAEKRWSEAAATYTEIMELNRYKIVPTFEELFEDTGDDNDEIIWSVVYVQDIDGYISVRSAAPITWGGLNHMQFFQGFIDKFLMTDGKTIEESELYDPANPFENRDPRLYRTVALPGYSTFHGIKFYGHPDTLKQFGQFGAHVTGYGFNKLWSHTFTGNRDTYGADIRLIRYAEVLLSRLESELEAGTSITQDLLDNTINKVRQRAAVNMPPVTTTDVAELREIVRNERAVELACEGGIRYWDLKRWNIAHEVLTGDFYGLKITDDPENYTGNYPINDKGHLIVESRVFKEHYYLWPIPLTELDVNPNLKQNPGYQ